MSLGITWYTLDEVEAKFGLNQAEVLKWVEEGLIRADTAGDKVLRINIDDLKLKVKELTEM